MTTAAAVLLVFAVVLVGGLVLRQWSQRRIAAIEAIEPSDPSDLADPSRWPAPPPADTDENDPPGPQSD